MKSMRMPVRRMMVVGKTIDAVAVVLTPKDPERHDRPLQVPTKRKSNLRLLKEVTITPVVAEAVVDADVDHVEEAMKTTATRVVITRVAAVETVAVAAMPEAITTIATVVVAGVAEAMADAVAVAEAPRTTPVVGPFRTTNTILSATTRE